MEYRLLGQQITIDASKVAYNDYRRQYFLLAQQAKSRFKGLYQNNHSLEQVVKAIPDQVEGALLPVVQACIQELVDHDILTIDQEAFSQAYEPLITAWTEPYMEVCDKYAEITMNEAQMDEYRKARRQYRGRIVGGGFGFSGAVKGMAMAGAMNMAIGAGHMVFNALGKAASSISSSMKMGRIFDDPNTFAKIADGVFLSAFNCHYALIHCLSETGIDSLPMKGMPTEEAQRAAVSILNNAQYISDDTQCRNALIQSFYLDPYQDDWYRFALRRFGDPDGQLEQVAGYFGVLAIQEEKEAQLIAYAKTLPLDTEAQALEAHDKVLALCAKMHYTGDMEVLQEIDDAISRFDLRYRTVEGVVFPSRREADEAREEQKQIQDILRSVDFQSLSSMEDAEQRIGAYASAISKRYQEDLQQRRLDLKQELCTVDILLPESEPLNCETPEEAVHIRAVAKKLYQALEVCGDGPDAEQALLKLQAQIRSGNNPAVLAHRYLDEIQYRLDKIDQACRTALGKQYATREQARQAEKTYQKIKDSLSGQHAKRHIQEIKHQIVSADLSQEAKDELDELAFRCENSTQLKAIGLMSTISALLLLAIVIGSYFFQISATGKLFGKSVDIAGIPLVIQAQTPAIELDFYDGVKNGLVIFGRAIGDMFVEGVLDYLEGFGPGIIGNIVWAVAGFFWLVIRQMLLVIPRYLVTLVLAFIQPGSIGYYFGYIVSSAAPFMIAQFCFDEEKPRENVEQIKSWNWEKILKWIMILVVVGGICFLFIKNGG